MKRCRACDDLVALERQCATSSRRWPQQQPSAKRNKIESLTDSFARVDVNDDATTTAAPAMAPRRNVNVNVDVTRLGLKSRLVQVDVHVETELDSLATKLDDLLDEPLPVLRLSTRVLQLPETLDIPTSETSPAPLLRPAWRAFERVCVHAA